MSLTQKLMSLVDDSKENMQENDYLQICNLLKKLYIQENTKNEEICYIKIEYVPDIIDFIVQDIGKLPFHQTVIKYTHTPSDEARAVNYIETIIYKEVFDKLSIECYDKIINAYGGVGVATEKMKEYIRNYDTFMQNIFNEGDKHFQSKVMTYYVIDTMIVEFDHVEHIDDAIDIEHLRYICNELTIRTSNFLQP